MMLLLALSAWAQKGVAEPDYYPMNYSGNTWTGKVTAVDENKREFTLTYKKKDKEETFTAVLPKGYKVKMSDGKDYDIKMSDLSGLQIKVYYITKTVKNSNGEKIKTNEAFKIKFIKE